jgi:beta-glucosidase/6-phospho-beta-glucosidase/beta-galactosidase
VDLIADPGHQAYRFSIEWSRIEPRPGRRDDDSERRRYVALRLAAVHEALRLGVGVRGYLYWSMMDNFEWGSFVPRFGLVHVDFHTYQRTPKPSAFFYRNIIRARGLDSESARGITAVAGKASE